MIINKLIQFFRPDGMSCDEVMEVLQAYLDGEVDAETARKVAEHLDQCSMCDDESAVFRNIKQSLAARSEPVDPDVMASLRAFGDRLVSGELD